MSDEIPSIVHHLSLGTNDFDRALAFYDRVMPTVGARKVLSLPGAAAYGKQFPEFWIQIPLDRAAAGVGNGTHVAFIASSREVVDAFHAAALEAGATDDGPPGLRTQYGPDYYACYVRDLDGHKIEAAVIP